MEQQTNDLIKNELDSNEVCLFMKGTPDAPQCGFSMAVSNILKILEKNSVHYDEIGAVDKSRLIFDNKINLSVDVLEKENITWLRKYMVN